MLVAGERREGSGRDMGGAARIANPGARKNRHGWAGSCARVLPAAPEQRIGGGAVGGGLVAVCCHAGDLGLEQRDPFVQFGLGVGTEILPLEVARCIALGPRQIGLVHWPEHRKGTGLLSIGKKGMRRVNVSG